ncbi:hypothetical protein HR12_24765 [Microbacterium sp. SUBG005]|nr:hypothetical protein HR12_24765 [Microbacterium sp. SUBG005]
MRRGAGGILSLLAVGAAILTGCTSTADAAPSETGFIVTERGWWSDADPPAQETERPSIEVDEAPADFVNAVRAALSESSPLRASLDDALAEAGEDFCSLAAEADDRPPLPEVVGGVRVAADDAVVIASAARSILCPSD